jgi:hypothetical protein
MNPMRAVMIVVAFLGACEPAPIRVEERDPSPGACQSATDCVLATTPANCAEGTCVNSQCRYKARDSDGDTFRAKVCSATDGTAIELGTDCDDTRAEVNPQGTEACNGRDDNCSGVVDEGIDPQGTCSVGTGKCARTGRLECKNGTFSKCNATPGTPQPDFPRCDGQDYACDGATQLGCSCTVGSSIQGTGPTAGWNWCQRNCETVKRECHAGKFFPNCVAAEGEQPQSYCKDVDGDGFFNPNDCQTSCSRHTKPPGAPSPLVGVAAAPFLLKNTTHVDCNDGNRLIHPQGTDTCTEDRNCNGRAGDGLPRPNTSVSCSNEMCGYAARKTVQSNCTYGACTLTASGIASATSLQRLNCTGSGCGWEHDAGGPWGNGWKVEGSDKSEWVVRGPGKRLPAGDYTVNFVGVHWTSSTWLDVFDQDGGPVPPAIHLQQGVGAKDFNESISFHAQPCHRYEFRVHGNHFGWFTYGMEVKSITLTRH